MRTLLFGLLVAALGSALGCSAGPGGTSCINAGFTLCGSTCYDLQNDANHCGSCIGACSPSQACVAGTCTTRDAGPPDAWVAPPHDAAVLPDAWRPDAWTPPVVGMCQSCDVATCASGLDCAFRRCDGVALCYDATNGCDGCPSISDFQDGCSTSADCGPRSDCVRLSRDFGLGCLHQCTTESDCTSAPTGFDDRGQRCIGGHCWMACDVTVAATCPFALTCRTDQTCGF